RVRHDHRRRDSVLMGLPSEATLRRLVERGGHEVPIPSDGVLVTTALAKILGLAVGDRVDVELMEGERQRVRPIVAGFVDESVGLQLYAGTGLIAGLAGDLGAVSSAVLKVDPARLVSVEEALRRSPLVIDVSAVAAAVQR